MTYAPELQSLNNRPLPEWYDAAKFGVFIHWGVFSIPAFAPQLGSISDAFKLEYDRAVAMVPYTEWYANAIKVPGTPSAKFHEEHYGNAPYENFKEPFLEALKQWDPAQWAETFRDAGARYVVLVTKHHDGFCLWPSAVPNPHRHGWHSGRDIVGELAAAVRAAGMRFGVYYSGGIDWTFNPEPLRTIADFVGSVPGGDYPRYAMAQTRELIERYEPSVLWNDIAWPTKLDELLPLFADYYNAVPDGVVNDRWPHVNWGTKVMRTKVGRRIFDLIAKRHIRRNPDALDGMIPPVVPHSDFRTPEYVRFSTIQSKKWEATRGMSYSFGYNRLDREADYQPSEQLLSDFIDGVSKGGNLLLNIGPRGEDAQIPQAQLSRLRDFGGWLRRNGEAIYGTRPWLQAEAETADGLSIRFTDKGGEINAIVLGRPAGEELRIRNFNFAGRARRLEDGSPVTLHQQGDDLVLGFTRPLAGDFAPVVVMTPEA